MNDTSIRLPVNSCNEPNYGMIETYMAGLKADITNIPDYFLNEGYEKASWYLDNIEQEIFESEFAGVAVKKEITLSDRRWNKFILGNIVESVQNGKSYNASDLVSAADGTDYVSYVTRTDNNNGISMYVQSEEYDGLEKANAITIGDTTATIFFQDHDFITGPHIIVIRADWLNVYTANFIITLLNQENTDIPYLAERSQKI